MINRIAGAGELAHNRGRCLKTLVTSGYRTRQTCGFFSSRYLLSSGAMGQNYKTRKGNTARSAGYEFSTCAPSNLLENGLKAFTVSTRSISMPNTIKSASALDASIPDPICIEKSKYKPLQKPRRKVDLAPVVFAQSSIFDGGSPC